VGHAWQVRLASVRRSLFVSDTERSKFLNHLVTGTRDILRLQQGLSEHNNYHEFCRLLGRLKTNYQLSELVTPIWHLPAASLVCTCRRFLRWALTLLEII
jgi:hypothetical protein